MPTVPPVSRPLGLMERLRSSSGRAVTALARTLQQRRRAPLSERPPSPFEDWTFDDVEEALAEALEAQTIDTSRRFTATTPAPGDASYPQPRAFQDPIAINRAFFDGDHWMNGAGWVGPHPAFGDEGFTDAMNEIALAFTSKNAVREVVTRHTLGVIGRPFQWSFVPRRNMKNDEKPTEAEQQAIDEATALVRPWLEARKIPSLMRNAVSTLQLAERASLRLHIPAGFGDPSDNGTTIVRAASIEDALGKIYCEHDKPEDSTVVVDDDTKLECGAWLYEADVSVGDTDDDVTVDYAGIVYVDQSGMTVTRLAPRDGADRERAGLDDVEATLDLGGRLTMFEMRRSALVTPQVQQAQRALNLAESMIPRNVISGGFLERIILDAQMPGEPEFDADGRKTGRWIRRPFYTGAGTTNFIAGAEREDDQGNITHGTPSVVFREPIKPDASISASDKHYRAILEEVSQKHTLMSGDATASAVSRLTARLEFLNTLLLTQPEVEAALRFILETSLAMAETIANQRGKYTDALRAIAQCRLDAGQPSADERNIIEGSIGKTLSRETAMILLGVEDVDAEIARMNSDPLARATLAKAQADALVALTTAGASLDGAAAFIGIEDDELQALLTPSSFEPPPAPAVQPPGTPPGTTPQNGPAVPPTSARRGAPANGANARSGQRQNGTGANSGNAGPSSNGRTSPARSTSTGGSAAGGKS